MIDRRCIMVFVKVPGRGAVKSRLSRALDPDFVQRLYECMVLDTIDVVRESGIPFRIFVSPSDALQEAGSWLGREHGYLPQEGEDLGERMERAFVRMFSEGAKQAVLIGSDIPGLTAEILRQAFFSLAEHDAVIGPANDGGYYLIGFSGMAFSPGIFHAMPWSTGSVFRETVERLTASSLTCRILPERIDADTREDLIALLDRRAGQQPASRAMRLLELSRGSILG
jgi:hypothetical protein